MAIKADEVGEFDGNGAGAVVEIGTVAETVAYAEADLEAVAVAGVVLDAEDAGEAAGLGIGDSAGLMAGEATEDPVALGMVVLKHVWEAVMLGVVVPLRVAEAEAVMLVLGELLANALAVVEALAEGVMLRVGNKDAVGDGEYDGQDTTQVPSNGAATATGAPANELPPFPSCPRPPDPQQYAVELFKTAQKCWLPQAMETGLASPGTAGKKLGAGDCVTLRLQHFVAFC